ncbi:hypothetical protein A5675_21685 [Mycobacterium malmoense]|uniref:hypothetical protein n=1 Tax=Mycobacterium malmoense TaxID=1780 RepID=UPI00080B8362|nr:hypothetical protein [Mycobacterium malmoense]OCB33708.1 hypothetical protein A5675_21685 [Mycobacterium malmoense]
MQDFDHAAALRYVEEAFQRAKAAKLAAAEAHRRAAHVVERAAETMRRAVRRQRASLLCIEGGTELQRAEASPAQALR